MTSPAGPSSPPPPPGPGRKAELIRILAETAPPLTEAQRVELGNLIPIGAIQEAA